MQTKENIHFSYITVNIITFHNVYNFKSKAKQNSHFSQFLWFVSTRDKESQVGILTFVT